jgi:hypothetical protein
VGGVLISLLHWLSSIVFLLGLSQRGGGGPRAPPPRGRADPPSIKVSFAGRTCHRLNKGLNDVIGNAEVYNSKTLSSSENQKIAKAAHAHVYAPRPVPFPKQTERIQIPCGCDVYQKADRLFVCSGN